MTSSHLSSKALSIGEDETAALDKQRLSEIIVDSLFLLPQMTGDGDPLPISGVRGWVSSNANPYLNRVGLENLNYAYKISEVLNFFGYQGKGFTFVLGPEEIKAGLGVTLLSHGLKRARFWSLAGMHYEIHGDTNTRNLISIKSVALDKIEEASELIARSYGINRTDAAGIWGSKNLPPALDWKLYLAYLNDSVQTTVGFTASTLIRNDSVMLLRGSGVLPEYRRKGIYRELVLKRMALALEQGVQHAVVQSARHSSQGVLKSIGFREVCPIELYEWSPTFETAVRLDNHDTSVCKRDAAPLE